MHRIYALAGALLLLFAAGARLVAAQDAGGGAAIPAIGEAVPFIGPDGSEVASLTVTEVVDPFEDYDAGFGAPERGQHFVMVRLEIENISSRPFPIDPSSVRLQDSDGFLYSYTFVSRSPEETEAEPDLAFEDVPAGDTASGPIFFSVVNDVELVRVLYQPDFDRLVFLADLTLPAAATPVPTEDDEEMPAADEETPVATGGCADVESWYADATALIPDLETTAFADIPEADLDDAATQIADAIDELSALDVPPAAEEANGLILQALEGYAAAVDQAIEAEGDADALADADAAVQDAIAFVFSDVFDAVTALAADCGFDL